MKLKNNTYNQRRSLEKILGRAKLKENTKFCSQSHHFITYLSFLKFFVLIGYIYVILLQTKEAIPKDAT